MTNNYSRKRLLLTQKRLIDALVGLGPIPDDFDHNRVIELRDTLIIKRILALRRTWPFLIQTLGKSFYDLFIPFAKSRPCPLEGALADGLAFLQYLKMTEQLNDADRAQFLIFNLLFRYQKGRFVKRKGPAIGISILRTPIRIMIGIRLSKRKTHLIVYPRPNLHNY